MDRDRIQSNLSTLKVESVKLNPFSECLHHFITLCQYQWDLFLFPFFSKIFVERCCINLIIMFSSSPYNSYLYPLHVQLLMYESVKLCMNTCSINYQSPYHLQSTYLRWKYQELLRKGLELRIKGALDQIFNFLVISHVIFW